MKTQLKLEGLGLFLLFSLCYFMMGGGWTLFLSAFFAPDLSFVFYLMGARAGALAYNIAHSQGLYAVLAICCHYLHLELGILLCLIGLAHSAFDRMLGYGLKYPDSFQHTHMGWIGKTAEVEPS